MSTKAERKRRREKEMARIQELAEAEKKYLYHGTSAAIGRIAKSEGLKPRGDSPGVSTGTKDLFESDRYEDQFTKNRLQNFDQLRNRKPVATIWRFFGSSTRFCMLV